MFAGRSSKPQPPTGPTKKGDCTMTCDDLDTDRLPYSIGVDVGGTHTDLILSAPVGLIRSKAFTTHENYSRGIFDAIEAAAEQIGVSRRALLSGCGTFVNGSTIVTNVITELRGARVGVLITEGFGDTFRIAAGPRTTDMDDHLQVPVPDVVRREDIKEVGERVLSDGSIAAPMDEASVRKSIRELRESGVEAIAVCYLWSFANSKHEQRTREIVAEEMPDAFTTLSSEVHPVVGEYSRFMTAVFNSLSHRATTRYADDLRSQLEADGFRGNLTFFQGTGGSAMADAIMAKPVTLMQSGPAGGVMGARYAAKRLGLENVLVGDMGGTSFDTAVLDGLEPAIAKRASFGPFQTGINMIDIVSVGAGGGSIVSLDARGVPRVGPHSAGSEPGPACYGRGGTLPTVTDANVVLGLIDPDNYLRGRHQIDVGLAESAISTAVATELEWSAEQGAAAIYDLAVIEMANALRMVSIERGYDPREFTFFSYGGGLGLFTVEICRRLGIPTAVVPNNSAAFSAYGVLIADYTRQYERTVSWNLSDGSQVEHVNDVLSGLLEQAKADAAEEGIPADQLQIETSGDFRFLGQTYEVPVRLPDRLLTAQDAIDMADDFPSIYEANYGEGTAWKGSPVQLLNVSLRASHERPKPDETRAEGNAVGRPSPESTREVFLPIERRRAEIPIYRESVIGVDQQVDGPCIIDVGDTTLYLPERSSAARDSFSNFILTV